MVLYTSKIYKSNLDKYLEQLPDQPEVEGLIPGGKDLYRCASNSIADWPRSLGMTDDLSMYIHEELVDSNMVTSNGAGTIPSHDTCV